MKNGAKKIKRALLLLMILALTFAAVTVFALAGEESIPGLTQDAEPDANATKTYPNATYEIAGGLSGLPSTLEAWVYIPSSLTTGDVGVIFGNSEARNIPREDSLNFEIAANRIPTIYTNDKTGYSANTISFTDEKSVLPLSEWVHLALVYDNASGVASCYVNGVLTESKYFYPTLNEDILINDFVLGGDCRELNTRYFKGGLGDITVYSDARTAAEIKADFDKGLDMTAAELDRDSVILYYDIDAADKGKDIIDESGNGNNALYDETWLTEEQMAEIRKDVFGFTPAYTFAIIGDTQKTVRMYPEAIPELYQWLVDNKTGKNIVYSIGLGDITDVSGDGTDSRYDTYRFVEDSSKPYGGYYVIDKSAADPKNEWDVAYHAITIMDGNLEYSLLAGNHDYASDLDAYFSKNESYISQFVEHGGIYGYTSLDASTNITKVSNTWRTLRVGNVDYLIMNLNYNTPDAVFTWANEILGREEFKNHHVIISTHAYLNYDAETLDKGNALCGTKTSGVDYWDKLVKNHDNVKLVLSGHVDVDKIVYKQREGCNGTTVTEVLVNAQSIDKVFRGTNMVAMFGFSEDGSKLAIEYYSVSKGMYLKTLSQVLLDLNADAPVIDDSEVWLGNSIAPSGSGTKDNPYSITTAGNLLWMAEQVNGGKTDFSGVYFSQKNDLDLGGYPIPSVGYYYNNESDKAAFCGVYDGNGFSIKNGKIEAYSKKNEASVKYGYGLFGVIFGAVIEDVTLENIEVVGLGVTGGIVGRAASPLVSDANYASFNIISGCTVKDTVRIVASDITPLSSLNFDNESRAGRLGSVCGMAHATVIEGCVSYADIKFGGDYGIAGGIVGSFGLNSTVTDCAFKGSLTLCDALATQTSMYGGIAGIMSPTTKWGSDLAGYAQIIDCYNEGNLYFETASLGNNVHWGGILGGAPWINYVAPTEAMPYPYLIEGCINLTEGPARIKSNSVYGGITGKNAPTAGVTSTLYIKDSYSVAITNANVGTGDLGTNEYRYTSGTTKDGKNAVEALGTVATVTAADMSDAISGMDTAIAAVKADDAEPVWLKGSGAPTVKPATAGVKYYDIAKNLYYVYNGSSWALYGGVNTEYGIIPESSSNPEANPFVIFKNGEFVQSSDSWLNVIAAAVPLAGNESDVVTVVLRRDYTNPETSNPKNYNELVGKLVIDLGGFTLTTSRELIQINTFSVNSTYKQDEVYITVKNGTILQSARRTVSLLNKATSDAAQKFYLTFEDVTLDCRDATYTMIVPSINNGTHSAELDLIFDNCTIDLSQNTGTKVIIDAKSSDSNNLYKVNTVFKGGEIKANSDYSDKILVKGPDNADTLVFEKDENGNYIKLTVPNTVTPTNNLYDTQNTGLAYMKISDDGTNATYQLKETSIPGCGTIPEEYYDVSIYPFLIFKNGVCVGAGDKWNTSKTAGVIPTAISEATAEGDVVTVVLRRDYVHTGVHGNTTANTFNKLVGKLVIDLGGYTVTTDRELIQFNTTTVNSTYKQENVEVEVKNGTILQQARRAVNLLNKATADTVQKFKLTFESVTIDHRTSDYTLISLGIDGGTLATQIEIIYDNCIIDLSNNTGTNAIVDSKASDSNNLYKAVVTFKGGKIISNYNCSEKLLVRGSDNIDTLVFEKDGNGNYTKIVMPSSLAAPTNIYDTEARVNFILVEEEDGASVYTLVEDVYTKYGYIPYAYSDEAKYPFVLFNKDGYVIAYESWYDFILNIKSENTDDSMDAVLLVRADHTSSTKITANFYLIKHLTVDLDGHKLTRGSAHLFNLSASGNIDFSSNITVKNGKIETTHNGMPPISFNSGNKTTNADARFNFVFENITFSAGSNHSGNLVMEVYSDGTYGSVNSMVFNGCTFDATKGNITGLFDLIDNESKNKIDISVQVNGGSIIANSNITIAELDSEREAGKGSPDSFTFGKYSGEYTTLTLPTSASAPTETYNGLKFVKGSENGTTTTYILVPSASLNLDFTPKASVTLDSTLIFNIYLPAHAGLGTVTLDGAPVELGEAVDGYYVISTPLMASESAEELKLVVNLTVDGTALKGSFTFSTVKYAEKLLATAGISAAEQTLARDMLAYINSAYLYFNGSEVAEITALLGGYTSTTVIDIANAKKTVPGLSGATFTLEAKPTVQFFFAEGFDYDDFTFKVGSRTLTVADVEEKTDEYVKFALFAYEMTETFSYTVNAQSGEYNLIAYYAYASGDGENDYKGEDKAELTDLAAKFYNYCLSAKAYRASVIGK